MTEKTKRYTLIAAVGDGEPGSSINLTDAQAESPLYASRVTLGGSGAAEPELDADSIRADVLADIEKNIPPFLADAKAKGEKLVEDGKAEAAKVVDDAKAEAKKIVEAAQAEAMKLAAKPAK